MRKKVSISDVIKSVDGTLFVQGDYDFVRWIVASGLMSDVLTTEEEEILLISSLSSPQVVRTADMIGANAILICCGKTIANDTTNLAKELGITIVGTSNPVFETCHLLNNLFFG